MEFKRILAALLAALIALSLTGALGGVFKL